MSAVAHYLEHRGIPTTGISLVREHTAALRPPRALWVPFPLGRPFGAPNNPEFQRRVLHTALGLLTNAHGPVVLKDFPDDAPDADDAEPHSWVCPLPIPNALDVPAIQREIDSLMPWYELAKQNADTTPSLASGRNIHNIAAFLESLDTLDSQDTDAALSEWLTDIRLACADARAWYEDSANAQPGESPSPSQASWWFWRETEMAKVIARAAAKLESHPKRRARLLAFNGMVPRDHRAFHQASIRQDRDS